MREGDSGVLASASAAGLTGRPGVLPVECDSPLNNVECLLTWFGELALSL